MKNYLNIIIACLLSTISLALSAQISTSFTLDRTSGTISLMDDTLRLSMASPHPQWLVLHAWVPHKDTMQAFSMSAPAAAFPCPSGDVERIEVLWVRQTGDTVYVDADLQSIPQTDIFLDWGGKVHYDPRTGYVSVFTLFPTQCIFGNGISDDAFPSVDVVVDGNYFGQLPGTYRGFSIQQKLEADDGLTLLRFRMHK